MYDVLERKYAKQFIGTDKKVQKTGMPLRASLAIIFKLIQKSRNLHESIFYGNERKYDALGGWI
jgi:hypothetical protein